LGEQRIVIKKSVHSLSFLFVFYKLGIMFECIGKFLHLFEIHTKEYEEDSS
jgi:hypothetical protein